ncbi:UNVERIFIED_CONTAM: hypothetical protein O8I53_08265 [Campylobacter lari]
MIIVTSKTINNEDTQIDKNNLENISKLDKFIEVYKKKDKTESEKAYIKQYVLNFKTKIDELQKSISDNDLKELQFKINDELNYQNEKFKKIVDNKDKKPYKSRSSFMTSISIGSFITDKD